MAGHLAGWLPDPTGRHQHRYWDGSTWTEHVADGGFPSTDPPAAPMPRSGPDPSPGPVGPWRAFRRLPAVVQLGVGGFLTLLLAVGAATGSPPDRQATLTATPATTGQVAPSTTERWQTTTSTAAATTTSAAVAMALPADTPRTAYKVASVTDGDTVRLTDGQRVRLAQVDAPEVSSECFSAESTRRLTELAGGATVYLRRPSSAPATDTYGRTVAELLVVDGDQVASANEAMVREGFAELYEQFASEDPDLARRLLAAESDARAAGRGLWSACAAPAAPPPTAAAPVAPTATAPPPTQAPGTGSGCTPGYDPCIPPGDDVDCAGGSGNGPRYVRGPVRVDHAHGDPYGLDADKDGTGCET